MMDWALFETTITGLLKGLYTTLQIGLLGNVLALSLALPLALMRVSGHRLLKGFSFCYSTAFRGTPLLVQLFLLYYGVGTLPFVRDSAFLWWLLSDGVNCAILAIGLNSGAYMSEAFRGGFQSVPKGQLEAARAIGMSPRLVFQRVLFPLALRQALPAYSNEIVLAIKGTSLASTIAVMELTGHAKRLMNQNYAIIETFVLAGLLYLLINFTLLGLVHMLERRLNIRSN
ncbi:ABC transporter permease [Alcaligenes endophyticus]|uniref:ABC transporter permease subunit n=1 Tax=Alcaligenes endophyticus TaxID=1929088 RepID=A0ABT8EEI5_9BURK|nr:ABC transporter permease subunit [Alcaligenes endophyticus]MCX5592255.1 ABC transporter permease subunit [Alcaligenes endophyticus]MDN4119697.1 ABC transporter permease subunit [Alcaligenes endophyticus]